MSKGNVAVEATLIGAAVAYTDQQSKNNRQARRTRDSADEAKSIGNAALQKADSIANSGFFERLTNGSVGDFLVGLIFPGQIPTPTPSANASLYAIDESARRPVISEELGAPPLTWPGPANPYNSDGDLVNPDGAATGQNFLTGLALGFQEVRAFLTGLTLQSAPSQALTQQFFRLSRGFADFIYTRFSNPTLAGFQQADFDAAWARFMGVSASAANLSALGLYQIDSFVSQRPTVSNTLVESELGRQTLPANAVTKANDIVSIDMAALGISSHSTDHYTARWRLDGVSGTQLYVGGLQTVSSLVNLVADFQLKLVCLRPGASGQALVATSGGGIVINIDWTVAHSFLLTTTYDVADPGNQIAAVWGNTTLAHSA